MTEFEPQIHGVGSDRSTNCATTTAQTTLTFKLEKVHKNEPTGVGLE